MSPRIMGIVNANPDSFSDPGVRSLDELVADGLAQVEAGAELIDVGGESGVTHTAPIAAAEEKERVVPLVERLVAEGITVSVDTWKPEVAHAVLASGASMINDVSGLLDARLAEACAEHGAALVVMHTRAEPKVKSFPGYEDVVEDVREFLKERIELARSRGVKDDKIVIDPGPDFAKTPAETVELLRRLHELDDLRYPLLLAVSRKDCVGALTGRAPAERLGGTLGAVIALADHADILRVHDVAAVADCLRVYRALRTEVTFVPDLDPALRREGVA
jgi:dihydropteroate synthase